MKFKSKIKEQKGSITLFVLISIMFFVVVLVGLYVNSSYKIQKQQKEIEKIQKNYNKVNINELYEETYNKYMNTENLIENNV